MLNKINLPGHVWCVLVKTLAEGWIVVHHPKWRGCYLINLLPIVPDCLFETLEKQSIGIDSGELNV